MQKNHKCQAIASSSGKPCNWAGKAKVGGKYYCQHHAKIARKEAPALVPEKQYQEALQVNTGTPANKYATFAEEVIALTEAGISTQALQWILEGWARTQTKE